MARSRGAIRSSSGGSQRPGPDHPRQHREMLVAACEGRELNEVRAHALDHVGAERVREGLRAVEHQLVALHVLDALRRQPVDPIDARCLDS